jgi:signal transduction histidine kinase
VRAALDIRFRPRPPRRTARLRLALLYGCVFVACGAGLLGLTYLLTARSSGFSVRLPGPPGHIPFPPGKFATILGQSQHAADLHSLLLMSGVALGLMATVAVLLGWVIAGPVLRPLRTITSAARNISATNLNRRVALAGPDDELKELGDTLDALLERLEVAFESQRRFVANAPHELRTPLARLKTLLQVALSDPDARPASLRHAQERALASEQQLEELIDSLLALARGEQAVRRGEPVDLAKVTRALLQARMHEVERRQLRANAELDPAWTDGDPQLLERLVANLLDNAIAHNAPGGSLEVTSSMLEGRVSMSVANTGRVIPPDELDRLKRPFQRLGPERTNRGDGHGLGLSIIAAIATSHGGTLQLHARREGGLHARVELPSRPALPESACLLDVRRVKDVEA